MPRAIWSGSISFGLVNIPVRMYSAIDEHDVHFHLLHTKDDSRIGYQKTCKKEDKPVPEDEIERAYEVSDGEYVYVTDEDLEAAGGAKYRTIDLVDFVPYEQIDPIYFEDTFFLGPAEGAEKVYSLLVEALDKTGLVGVGTFVMREKQQLGCVRVRDGLLTLVRMYFADEIRASDELAPTGVRVNAKEVDLAIDLIERSTGDFDIGRYQDEYREALLDVIRKKQRGETVQVEEPEAESPPDLLDALRASLEAHRANGSARRGKSRATKTSRRRAAKRSH